MAARTPRGIDVARAYGLALPPFANLREARRALFADRNASLSHFASLDAGDAGFAVDFTPESLRSLERWYFALYRSRGFKRLGSDRRSFEAAMAYYFGAVAKRSVPGSRWVVEAYAFMPHRYEIGLATGSNHLMLGGMCTDWYATPRNARQDALFRRFVHTWPPLRPRARPALGSADETSIASAIERLLRRKSSPLIYPGELVTFVRHRLRDERIPAARIASVVNGMVTRGIVARETLARKAGFRYRLA